MKYTVLIVILVAISATAVAQVPCERLPQTSELLVKLSEKPINAVAIRQYQLNCNVDSSIINRVMYLLRWQWTEAEKIKYTHSLAEKERVDISDSADLNAFKKKVDSLVNTYKIDPGLTLLPAKLDLQAALPFLEAALKDTVHYHRHFVELALARLGNKAVGHRLIEQMNNNTALNGGEWLADASKKVTKLMFIASQESIAKVAAFLDTSKIRLKTAHGGIVKNAVEIVWFLSNLIQNKEFQSHANWIEAYNFEQIDDKMILYCRDWLLKNKGKYEINRAYCLLY